MANVQLTQGKKYYNPQTGVYEGIVNFDTTTGAQLGAGATTNFLPGINAGLLNGNGTMPQLPPVNPTMTPQSFVQGIPLPQAPVPLAPSNASAAAQQGTRTGLIKRLQSASQQLLGQGGRQLELEQAQGIPQATKDINALNEQITGLKAAFDAKTQATNTNTFGVNAQSTRIDAINRQAAVQLGGLSALLMAKQGSLDSAKAEVTRTLDLEFDPIKQDIENTKMFLDINYQDLTRAEKKEADALNRSLDKQRDDLNYFRRLKESAFNKLMEGGTQAQANALSNAKTAEDVYKIFGTSIIAGATPLLPNGQPDVVSQLTQIIKSSSAKVPNSAAAIGVISGIQQLAGSNPEGKFKGVAPFRFLPALFGGKDRRGERITNRSDFGAIEGAVQTWMTGASVGEDQRKFVESMVPHKGDTDFKVREKLNNLSRYMQSQAQAELSAVGISFNPLQIDYFATPVDNYITTSVTEVSDPYELYLQGIYGQ